ncbi:iron-sulfur cluster assembly protein [Rubrobacter taiwanensis]|jgi:metal-sulfur cluster biosynthetic enzyme|uniref:Iron-sulfur cluster assembly protein n=1 Tax=Rubrobacter taiwanensis TaxID=185139 RepID=A0A4R1BTH6_9ACTN|nr:iron-sulfur cluster assembly protein [Rubrobacter taiwanensis]TCJ20586.1 iron-sulfur cluster assembly protein [Rubrobacter taiwanensis]
MIEREKVLDALSGVRDPELDEPITDLRFVAGVEISGDEVEVRLRLPTYFCAPNFAYLMAADAKAAALSVPGVREARVRLEDHFTSEEINAGIARNSDFEETFTGLADGELDELRELFRRKAFVARGERLFRELMREGHSPEDLAALRVGDLPESETAQKYLERRAELGLDVSPESPLVVDPEGNRVPEEAVVAHLRFARMTRVSIEGNASLCRGLLRTRYGLAGKEEALL